MWYFQILGTDIFLHRYFNDAGQPTTHFNVLNEAGLDKRRVIVDENAPLFYVGLTNVYPPMQFLLAKQDLVGREEQTMLLMKTMADFGCDMSKVALSVLEGEHSSYFDKCNAEGKSVLGDEIVKFIMRVSKNSEESCRR